MNRVDLEWGLKSVLPHVGRLNDTNIVGLTYRDGCTYAFATDRYTAAVARMHDGINVDVRLTPQEAGELMRFVRTDYKDEEQDDFAFAVAPGELHIGFERQVHRDGSREQDSAVFETTEPGLVTLDYILGHIRRLDECDPDLDGLIVQPKLLEKFAKAQRAEFERLRIYPCRVTGKRGAAVVTIGSDFIGAIAGMSDDELGAAMVADFLSTERKDAA